MGAPERFDRPHPNSHKTAAQSSVYSHGRVLDHNGFGRSHAHHVHTANKQPADWWKLSDRLTSLPAGNAVSLDFAIVDYEQGTARLLDLPPSVAPEGTASSADLDVQPSTGHANQLVYRDGDEEHAVTRVRRGGKNTRVRFSDGTTRVVPNSALRPANCQ